MDEPVDLGEVLTAIAASLQGIRSELRAMRLEQRAALGMKVSEVDVAELAQALTDADEIAYIFGPAEEASEQRVLS